MMIIIIIIAIVYRNQLLVAGLQAMNVMDLTFSLLQKPSK
jgi:hypothetical protein